MSLELGYIFNQTTLLPGSSVIPLVKGLMLNIRFTYVVIFHLMQDFDLAEWYSNALKSQTTNTNYAGQNTAIDYTDESQYNHNSHYYSFMTCSLTQHWAFPVTGKECGVKPAQALLSSIISLFIAQLWHCVGLSQVYLAVLVYSKYTLPCAGMANSGRHSNSA